MNLLIKSSTGETKLVSLVCSRYTLDQILLVNIEKFLVNMRLVSKLSVILSFHMLTCFQMDNLL